MSIVSLKVRPRFSSIKMSVPSGAMAGAVLTGGRCEPQVTVGVGAGCPSAPRTGQGRSAFAYRQKH